MHSGPLTGPDECQGIFLPSFLVEVSSQKPAGFVEKERIYSNGFLACQMLTDDFIGYRVKSAGLPIDLLVILRATGKYRLPILLARGMIGPRTVLRAPSLRIDVLPSAE
jgi:hypothetical protein